MCVRAQRQRRWPQKNKINAACKLPNKQTNKQRNKQTKKQTGGAYLALLQKCDNLKSATPPFAPLGPPSAPPSCHHASTTDCSTCSAAGREDRWAVCGGSIQADVAEIASSKMMAAVSADSAVSQR
jgi:hypothetical protein